jgi:hypothetical protein
MEGATMKKAIYLVIAIAVFSCSSTNASAVQIRGVGSCGEWITETTETPTKFNTRFYDEAWLIGYLSGLAVGTNTDFLAGTDHQSIYLWVTNYCQANPLDDLAKAAKALYMKLKERKGL